MPEVPTPEHEDFFLWGHAFYEAPVEDLRHIAALIGARGDGHGQHKASGGAVRHHRPDECDLQAQAMELAQLHALHHEEEIAAVRRDYAQAIGRCPHDGGGNPGRRRDRSGGAVTLIQIAPIKLDP